MADPTQTSGQHDPADTTWLSESQPPTSDPAPIDSQDDSSRSNENDDSVSAQTSSSTITHAVVSNHGYNESFSRSRLSVGTALENASTSDNVEDEPDVSWLGEDAGPFDGQEQHTQSTPTQPHAEAHSAMQSHPVEETSEHVLGNEDIDAWGATEDDAWLAPSADDSVTQPPPSQSQIPIDSVEATHEPEQHLPEALSQDTTHETVPEAPQDPPASPLQPPATLSSEVSDIPSLPEPVAVAQSAVEPLTVESSVIDLTSNDTAADESSATAKLVPKDEPHVTLPQPAETTADAEEIASIEHEIAAEAPVEPHSSTDLFGGDASDNWLAESDIQPSAPSDALDATETNHDDVDSSVIVSRVEDTNVSGPDFGDTSVFEDEWSKIVPTSEAKNSVEEPSTIEDEWSKAFGGDESNAAADDPWAALGDELDDDGFLEDEPESATATHPQTEALPATASQYAPAASVYAPSVQPALPRVASSSSLTSPYAPASIQSQQPVQKTPSAGPMKFFEDLPTGRPTPARRPKPQAPVLAPTPPPPAVAAAPPPSRPSQAPSAGAPAGPSRSISSQYGSFVPPPRQELFPPQPSVPPPVHPAALSTPPPPPVPSSTSARYSPAPVHSTAPTQSSSSRYASASVTAVAANTAPSAGSGSAQTQAPAPAARYSPAASASSTVSSPYAPSGQAATSPPSAYAPASLPSQATVAGGAPLAPPPKQNARYSPAPPGAPSTSQHRAVPAQPAPPPQQATLQQTPPPPPQAKPSPRAYSPTSAAPGGPPPAHRFAPRTSSPLAYAHGAEQKLGILTQSVTSESVDSAPVPAPQSTQPPPMQTAQGPLAGPRRTKTSSPEAGRAKASALSRSLTAPFQPKSQSQQINAAGHTADPDDAVYIRPQDDTAVDPLQRWKGAPIVQWGANGVLVTTFPSRTPRYGGGQAAPMIKSLPGEIKIRKCTDAVPELAALESFPGPLRAKGKKKEVVAWLSTYIEALQRDQSHSEVETMDARVAEKILLWQIMKILVEHDGKLSGDPSVDLAVRQALAPDAETAGLSGGPSRSDVATEVLTSEAITEVGQSLLRGDREKAVWHAVDNRMWAHAMLISSTLNPTVWKQVAQEFVRKEVRNAREGNQSMAALYNVFAGNHDESMDELVPASARAGFQMMSSLGSTQQQNALDGVNKWQETLGLILSNRSNEDENAILALGKLLAGYGRIEAAHICFLFARSVAHFSGADDAQANFTLLGAAFSEGEKVFDLDNVVLTEIYEFGLSLGPNSPPAYYAPHLQSYKLRHAYSLAETGSRTKALQYCDAIASATKSTTKLSLYYHPLLVSSVDDLAKRLAQIPKDGSSSWMARPSIEKVSGSMWARFNSFVAGDDGGDGASTGSGALSEGEAGPFGRVAGTPSISRTNSVTDIYGMQSVRAQSIPSNMNSRYAPSAFSEGHSPQSSSPYAPGAAFQRTGIYSDTRNASEPVGQSQQSGYQPASQQSNYGHGDSSYQSFQPAFAHDSAIPAIQEEPQTAGHPYGSPSGSSVDMGNPYAPSPVLSFSGSMGQADDANTNGFMSKPNGFPKRSTSYGPPPVPEQESSGGYEPPTSSYQPPQSSYDPSAGYRPSSDTGYEPSQSSSYEPSQTGGYEPPQNGGYGRPQNGGYEPPNSGSYQPPQSTGGYQPYQPEPDSPVDTKPKKKGIMDDDDDGFSAPAPSAGMSKAEKDRMADEAFRRAAEEDAKRDAAAKEARKSGSWFGGWLGAKKDPNAPVVHKAKLGEENSFVFDEATKKWVNKKAGASAATPAAAATPPPPRAGPPAGGPPLSRNMTPNGPPVGLGMSTTGPPSRLGTPGNASVPPSLQHVASVGSGATSTPPASGPPSRPATSMSNASSIDDLLGAPAPRKGGTVKKGKKGGRYVDIMAK